MTNRGPNVPMQVGYDATAQMNPQVKILEERVKTFSSVDTESHDLASPIVSIECKQMK